MTAAPRWLRENWPHFIVVATHFIVVAIVILVSWRVIDTTLALKEESGTIVDVTYDPEKALVWIERDDGETIGPLEYRALYWKKPRISEHVKLFRHWNGELIDFWYDNEEIFFESSPLPRWGA